ncbi:MAG: hypothetical protein J0M00_00410 [Burkholderiales bacterium]|nr:hypothetical protein [Burkholderiales bacterium]
MTIAAMLSLPFQRRRLRSTAVLTLMAWVLALLAGIVNACQLQTYTPGTLTPGLSTQGGFAERGLLAGQPLLVEEGDHDVVGGHEGQSDTGKAGCLKFCDDESSTVATAKTSQADLVGMVTVSSIDWLAAMPIATGAPWRQVERPVSQGPPLFIRFLRLTI